MMKIIGYVLLGILGLVVAIVILAAVAPKSPEREADDRKAMSSECSKIGAEITLRAGRTGGADNAIDAMERCAAAHGYKLNLEGKGKYEN